MPFAAEPDPARLGTIGLIDETSVLEKGTRTPGVQRQHRGCVGKVDNGIVTVHLGACRGDLKALLDADLFLPRSWDGDRPRCRAAGIPDDTRHTAKWKLAVWQWAPACRDVVGFDWLTFDEGYGRVPAMLWALHVGGQPYVGEAPVNYRVATRDGGRRIDTRDHLKSTTRKGWARLVVRRRGLKTVVRVAFRRAAIERLFRLAKPESGFTHFEGRNYRALRRHRTMALVAMGFAAREAAMLRKKTST